MRIIKEGHIPNFEYVFTCRVCGCEFAVTQQELINENQYLDKNSYKCPTCGTQVYNAIAQEVVEDTTVNDEPDIIIDGDLDEIDDDF